uniref:Uncharacterized protein n=1 Tax=Amphimedon queenslandica TaxID=400682 RepID=A0A1X7VN17_AMPQE
MTSLHFVSLSIPRLVLPSRPIIYLKKTGGVGRQSSYSPLRNFLEPTSSLSSSSFSAEHLGSSSSISSSSRGH